MALVLGGGCDRRVRRPVASGAPVGDRRLREPAGEERHLRRHAARRSASVGSAPGGVAFESFCLPSIDASSKEAATSENPMHSVPVWPESRYRMVEAIPANTGQSAWVNGVCLACGPRTRDQQRDRCSRCRAPLPRPVTKDETGELRLVAGFQSSYRRIAPDEPAATIRTASGHLASDRTVHPLENRVLSTLECALLQTIPPSFEWGGALERWGHTNVRA